MNSAVSQTSAIQYNVKTIRAAGLEAKWGRNSKGAPIIFARKPGTKPFYAVTGTVWNDAKKEGIAEAFSRHTMLGDFFYVTA